MVHTKSTKTLNGYYFPALAGAESRKTLQVYISVFCPDAYARHVVRADLPNTADTACILGKSSGRATEHVLRFCRAKTYQKNTIYRKTLLKKVQLVRVLSMMRAYFSTTAKNIRDCSTRKPNSNAWNHTFYRFSNFSDEVRLEAGHENCCRFATVTEVHQGAHICLAKCWINGKVLS